MKDNFLHNLVLHFEYMKITLQCFLQDIINQYNIMYLVDEYGFVYVEIHNGMYGLKQAAPIAFDRLVKLLKPDDCYPLRSNHGFVCCVTPPTNLCFV